ncbi:MAG: hypothetical protein J6Q32_02560 [Clostridia bacterium]|nr:hypothetical protein [Clostridia bacterium]
MSEFLTLFKYELKMQMPFFKRRGKDLLSNILVASVIAFVVYVAVLLLSRILANYISVEIDKVYEPIQRAREIMNLFYIVLMVLMSILSLERARKIFTDDKNKMVFLRLPVSRKNVFLTKFFVLTLRVYFYFAICILTLNITLSTIIAVDYKFWLSTFAVCLFMPLACMFIVGVFIVPYIKIVRLLSGRYLLVFILFTALLIGGFVLYSVFLRIVQTLLTTGSIRFLFNESTVSILQSLCKYCYPSNLFVNALFNAGSLYNWALIFAFALLFVVIVCVMSKKLYASTFYVQQTFNRKLRKSENFKCRSSLFALIKKEVVCVAREPKYLFSYLSIAVSMPIMVYCCYTLFDTLIYNALGVRVDFALALSVVALFGVLTNTFCSTNITREGLGILKIKTLPLKPSKLFAAKIIFCGAIGSTAIIISCILLTALTRLDALDGFCCVVIGITLTFAQILVATRMDLNTAKFSTNAIEVEKQSGKTILKIMIIGICLTTISAISALFFAFFASGVGFNASEQMLNAISYLLPIALGIIYLAFAIKFYRNKILCSFENLTC